MSSMLESVGEFCGSEHFFLLDPELKDKAELLLAAWCDQAGSEATHANVERSLGRIADLDVDIACKQNFPRLLKAYLKYVAATGLDPGADRWIEIVSEVEDAYLVRFREDGTVKGGTFKRDFKPVGRNDPCPCGSGKKFKKCCIDLLT